MLVYRIAKTPDRAKDLSGFGSYKYGGRWNSKGVYMLYTSMNSSLAYLESLVHFNELDIPPRLFVVEMELTDNELIFRLPDAGYPGSWQAQDNLPNKIMGDEWMKDKKFLAIQVRSAINPSEFNFLLNPMYPGFTDRINILSVKQLDIDTRLLK